MDLSIKVFLAGDSTCATNMKDTYPQTGWGQVIGEYFKEDVVVRNYAVNGRSTKSFISEGRLDKIKAEIGKGDFLFIQFGHNDSKEDQERHTEPFTTYKENLRKYIQVAENVGAIPVLITSMHRRSFDENGRIKNTHGDYPNAMRQLSKELNVALVDLNDMSKELYESYGIEKSKELFMWLEKGQYLAYPEGAKDDTHFNETGAKEIAKLIIKGLKALDKNEIKILFK